MEVKFSSHSGKGSCGHYHVKAWYQNHLFITVNRTGRFKKDMHRTVKLTHQRVDSGHTDPGLW